MIPAPARTFTPRTGTSTRSTAVDFFRGLGLWIIYTDHIDPNVWSNLTLWRLGFSDFAEIFVFLSGVIVVGAYERSLAAGDFGAALRKLGRRIGRLYVAHIVSLTLSLFILAVFVERGLRVDDSVMYIWMQNPTAYLMRILTLTYAPHVYALLPLYILVSPILLVSTIGLRRAPKLTLFLSAGLWLATQFPALDARMSPRIWYFHPLAWQFLFVLGAASRIHWDRLKTFADSRWTFIAAAALVSGSAVLKGLTLFPRMVSRLPIPVQALLMRDSGKSRLAPFRLIHFIALLVLVYGFMHNHQGWLRSRVARLAVACGVDSLFIYCCTLVLGLVANLILAGTQGGAVMQLELNIFGLALLCGLAWLRQGNAPLIIKFPLASQIRNSAE